METFGHNLKQAIAGRGLTPEQVAQVTGLGLQRIRALQEDDFTDLPDDGTVEESLRALARLLDVDPDQVIADYRRERERRAVPAPAPSHPEEEDGEAVAEKPTSRLASPVVPVAIILAVAVVTLVIWLRSPSGTANRTEIEAAASTLPPAREPARTPQQALAEPETPGTVADAGSRTPVDPVEPEQPLEAEHDEPPVMPAEASPAPPAVEPEPAGLSIPDHGVGTAVVNHELVGRTDRFTVGSRAWFWTFLQDGTPGQRVEHVWLHEGAVVARVSMTIGGSRWRVKSYKSLVPGSEGAWAVEVRDGSGRVLARDEFRCTAPARP